MKQFLLSALCAAAALPLLALPARAQSTSSTGSSLATPGLGTSGGPGGHRRGGAVSPEKRAQEIIAKYDKDGDHALNATELAAFFTDLRERMMEHRTQQPASTTSPSSTSNAQPKLGNPQERAAKVIAKFDKNGDGKLDVSELTAALIAQHERAMQRQGQGSAQGQSQTPNPSPSHSAPATTILSPAGS